MNIASHSNKLKLNNVSILVFAFEPEASFYSLDFDAKLKVLDAKIAFAERNFQGSKLAKKYTGVFVAPEYLFKKLSEYRGPNRYHSHQDKKTFIDRMKKCAKKSDLIIIPGTICWRKPSKKDGKDYYRNTAYLFHKTVVEKYKKQNMHICYDTDFIADASFLSDDPSLKYYKAGEGKPVRKIGPLSIGIEICYDNIVRNLHHKIEDEDHIDLHLIIADGLKAESIRMLPRIGLPIVKIDKESSEKDFRSIFGKVYKPVPRFNVIDIKPVEKTYIKDDLHRYQLIIEGGVKVESVKMHPRNASPILRIDKKCFKGVLERACKLLPQSNVIDNKL